MYVFVSFFVIIRLKRFDRLSIVFFYPPGLFSADDIKLDERT